MRVAQVDWVGIPAGLLQRGTQADEVPATEDWAFDRHITRGGAFRHDRDLARCARRHGAYEPDLEAIGVGFRLAAPAA